jgi:hypothetical protein
MSMGGQAEGLPCTDPVHNVVTAENKVNSKFRTRGGGGIVGENIILIYFIFGTV